jgi:hypothetical protein
MYTVYRIFNKTTNEYYIGYSSKTINEVLKRKLIKYHKNIWNPTFILFEQGDYISIEKLCNFEHQGACVDFIKMYNHYHAECVNSPRLVNATNDASSSYRNSEVTLGELALLLTSLPRVTSHSFCMAIRSPSREPRWLPTV